MELMKDLYYVGVSDYDIDLFEGQYHVDNGMCYNSYVIIDEKIAIMDSVDYKMGDEWLKNINAVLNNRQPDYLIIQHMEPDHSANILRFMQQYPHTTIVSNAKAFKMMDQFFDFDQDYQRLVVKNNDELVLGKHILSFILAPMVHWPEVMVTYDSYNHVLFSADAFGKFGAFDCNEDWDDEARRYYMGIVGPYGVQVQALLKKVADLSIDMICSLHGPILKDHLDHYIKLYDLWSSYGIEKDGVVIAYSSIYGHTKEACFRLAELLKAKSIDVVLYDLSRDDLSKCVSDMMSYSKVVFASVTYNNDIFPHMKDLINHLIARRFQNRRVAFIENGSWAPTAIKVMNSMLEGCKNMSYCNNHITINSKMSNAVIEQLEMLARELGE